MITEINPHKPVIAYETMLERVRQHTEGQRLLVVGGRPEPRKVQSITDLLQLEAIIWPESKKRRGWRAYEKELQGAHMLVLLPRFMSHNHALLRDLAKREGKLCFTLPRALGNNRIVQDFYEQLDLGGNTVPEPIQFANREHRIRYETLLQECFPEIPSPTTQQVLRRLTAEEIYEPTAEALPVGLAHTVARAVKCSDSFVRGVARAIRRSARGSAGSTYPWVDTSMGSEVTDLETPPDILATEPTVVVPEATLEQLPASDVSEMLQVAEEESREARERADAAILRAEMAERTAQELRDAYETANDKVGSLTELLQTVSDLSDERADKIVELEKALEHLNKETEWWKTHSNKQEETITQLQYDCQLFKDTVETKTREARDQEALIAQLDQTIAELQRQLKDRQGQVSVSLPVETGSPVKVNRDTALALVRTGNYTDAGEHSGWDELETTYQIAAFQAAIQLLRVLDTLT